MNKKSGFTLIEVLLVVGIIAILAAIVIVAINPARQLAQARNTQRWSNVNSILNAVHQYAVDHRGNLPSSISTTPTEICLANTTSTTCSTANLLDLRELTENENYLPSMPKDPDCSSSNNDCTANGSGYKIFRSANNRITVSAPKAEIGEVISITR